MAIGHGQPIAAPTRPSHPKGPSVSEGAAKPLDGVSAAWPRQACRLNRLALRLEKAGWSTAESWLRNQLSYDLWRARQHADRLGVTRFSAPEAA